MTNLVSAFGMQVVSRYSDSGFSGALKAYHVRSDYATAVYRGDPIIQVSTGSNLAPTGVSGGTYVGGITGQPIGTLPDVNVATAGSTNKLSGAIVGIGYNPQATDTQYGPASTDRAVLATFDPSCEYEIMSNGAAAAHTYTDIGNNANLASGVGETVFGQSGWVLDQTTVTTDATEQLTILSVTFDPQRNDMTAANPCFIVKINLHSVYATALVGI